MRLSSSFPTESAPVGDKASASARGGRLGSGFLEVRLVRGQSSVTRAYSRNPFKLLTPRSCGPSVWACVSHLGGGMLAGDEVEFDLDLGPNANAYLGTQASTKVYRSPAGRPCRFELRARIGAGARLLWAPDPVQCFANSVYEQRQRFELGPGAGLALVDSVSAGRTARGERWAFSRYRTRTEIFVAGQRAFVDALTLDPLDGPLASPWRLGRFNCLSMIALIGTPFQSAATQLIEAVARRPIVRQTPLLLAASALPSGAILRIAGISSETVARETRAALAFVSDWLQDDPWARKW